MSYKVQFLNDAEFEALPIPNLEDKVGFAHRPTRTAYVRKIAPVVDVFSALHELEHLQEGHEGALAHHYDKEHDVYYKGFQDMILPALGIASSFFLPGIGPALSGGLGQLGSMFSGALGSIPGIGGALSTGASAIGNTLGGIGTGIGKAVGGLGDMGKSLVGGLGTSLAGQAAQGMMGGGKQPSLDQNYQAQPMSTFGIAPPAEKAMPMAGLMGGGAAPGSVTGTSTSPINRIKQDFLLGPSYDPYGQKGREVGR